MLIAKRNSSCIGTILNQQNSKIKFAFLLLISIYTIMDVFCPLVVRFVCLFACKFYCFCFVFYWFVVILFWVQCTGRMHVFLIKAPPWCAWRKKEKRRKKKSVAFIFVQLHFVLNRSMSRWEPSPSCSWPGTVIMPSGVKAFMRYV